MLYYLFEKFIHDFSLLNLLRYITLRSGGAVITSLIISLTLMPAMIRMIRSMQQYGQPIRTDGPESHLRTKQGTPTMGGLMILFSVTVSTLLWGDLTNPFLWAMLLVILGSGLLGFMDDYLKVVKRNSNGISRKTKLGGQLLVGLIACLWIQHHMPPHLQTHLALPIFKNTLMNLGWFYLPFALLVIVGASNAVNLTDGLDGLAIMPVVIATGCFALISYIVGHAIFSDYLKLYHIVGAGEIAVFCAALIGAGLGFLWYNAQPAEIFMGDTGSLALGSAIGAMSVITKHELVLAIIGGLFVLEALSVIIQIGYFRISGGKRFFKMAPLHHHFEKCGWSESKIVARFWIIALVFAIVGLATLKVR
jgi:phospho-N-acetylmuramoyl-pentapeptide-transferase